MTLQGLIVVLFSMALAFATYLYVDYKKTGGYAQNSEGANGYRYPTDNNLETVKDCETANTAFPDEPPVSEEWMEGCKKYFEINN